MAGAAHDESFTAAFDGLFVRAFAVAMRLLGDAGEAEDVAAEALARAYARWQRIGAEPWVEGWVLRVATNLAIDVARKRTRARRAGLSSGARSRWDADHRREGAGGGDAVATGVPERGAADPSGDEAVLRLALAAALEALPRRQREVVALRYLADLSEVQVAAALGVSAGAVKTHLHRGTTALRARLGRDFEEVALDV
jgi:RNA polymerase sigma-70 factor (ECF subfamily)